MLGGSMKLVLKEDDSLNRGHLLLSYHMDDKEVAKGIVKRFGLCMKKCILYECGNSRKAYRVSYVEIYKIEMRDGKVLAYANRGNVLRFNKDFVSVREEVKPYCFAQITKVTLVNTMHVAYFERIRYYRLQLAMDNGEILIVNRSYHKSFIEIYKNA